MSRKILYLYLLLFSAFLVFATACNGTEQGKVRYKVRPEYTSIGEVAERHQAHIDDLKDEQIVQFLNETWAAEKYETLAAGESNTGAEAGYVEADVLRIPAGKVGRMVWGNVTITIPARAYSNIPAIDDEIQIVDALFVPPGQIAWRMNSQGVIEYKYSQDNYYPIPNTGWTVEPSLIVQPGTIGTRPKSDGTYEYRYAGPHPQDVASVWKIEPALSIAPGKMGTRLKEDGTYEFKGPGQYPEELAAYWSIVDAIQIQSNEFGVYIVGENEVQHVAPGIYYDKLPSDVSIFKRGSLRYRTLDKDVMDANKNPTDPACSSVICEYAITAVVIKNSNRDATVNVDILFHFVEDPDRLESYRYMTEMNSAVQDYVASPTRTYIRSFGSQFTADELRTDQGLLKFGEVIRVELQKNIDKKGVAIVIDEASIRNPNMNDKELREAAYLADIEREKAEARTAAAQSQLEALNAEDQVREKQREIDQVAYDTWLENQQRLLQSVRDSGLNWQQLWILTNSGIELKLQPDGNLASPGTYPSNNFANDVNN